MTNKIYPVSRAGLGGAVFFLENGSQTVVPGEGGVVVEGTGASGGPSGTMAATEATDTMAAFGQPPVGTLAATEATDTAKISGWVSRKPDDPVQSFNWVWSSGNRLATSIDAGGNGLIAAVTTNLAGATQSFDFSTAFNGRSFGGGANGPDYGGTPTANATSVTWQISNAAGQPGALIINGLRFANQDWSISGGIQDWGNWAFLGSLDGATWWTIGTFNLAITGTGYQDDNGNSIGAGFTVNFGKDNLIANIPWTYFQLVWTGGAWNGNRLCSGLDFMAFANPNEAVPDATVTHSSGLTVSGGSPSGTLQNYQNGNLEWSVVSDNANVPTVNGLTNGEYITFDWGAGKFVAPFRFRVSLNGTLPAVNYGTCQWSASNDGTTWANIGSSFTMNLNGQLDAVFDIDNPTRLFYQMWRLTFVSTTQTQLNGVTEFIFDMESQSYDILRATEAADTFHAVGYVGAFGVTGSLAASETTDMFAAVGYTSDLAIMASTEAKDTFSAYGYLPVRGALAATEAADKFAATGLGRGEDGVLIASESVDIFAATGYTPTSGPFAATENPDIARFIGAGVTTSRKRRVFIVT
jgi:hypothetical protein